jgi:hypothetical protein
VKLHEQLEFLDATLLSSVTSEFPNPLADLEKAAINAYLVLCHACIEEFIEDIFNDHLRRLSEMTTMPLVPRDVAGLLHAVGALLPESKRAPYKTQSLAGIATAASLHFEKSVLKENHGIKTRNILHLAKHVGLNWGDFESGLLTHLADLDTLGAKRGEAGHLSPFSAKTLTITRLVYPDEVRVWVAGARDAALAVRRYLHNSVDEQLRSFCCPTY